MILLRPSCVPSPTNFRSFLHANIDSETIEKSYFVGKDGRLLERAWQMEFYRAAIQALPSNIYISADVGAYWGSNGFLDFWIDDEHSWAIELLRDGSDASGHKNRLERGVFMSPLGKSPRVGYH